MKELVMEKIKAVIFGRGKYCELKILYYLCSAKVKVQLLHKITLFISHFYLLFGYSRKKRYLCNEDNSKF